ncbi:hypothetical protein QN277_003360 [Acacia crassicarpa]|nr:hypothetical protein QN277_003360 [Acacia crassicarpa]
MSHRKVHSQGSIPFSWEDEPGICKTPQGVNKFKSPSSSSSSLMFQAPSAAQSLKIPLPPCPLALPPRRTASGKGFRWQEDPFLVAYKEITKSEKISGKSSAENNKKKVGGFSWSVRKSKSIFSCTSSSSEDVRHGNFLKLSQLPRLPRYTSRSFKFGDELKPDFNYETWV